jgi:hypothetical protein
MKLEHIPFCAIRDFPLAGRPTITTQICVSSTWTPTPLVFVGRAISMIAVLICAEDEDKTTKEGRM